MPDTSEPSFKVDLLIRVFGMDAGGRPFSQDAHCQNISARGAQLSGLEKQLRPGDIIGVQFGDRKARCTVMWAGDGGRARKIEAGVKILLGQPCPWQAELERPRTKTGGPISRTAPVAKDKRKFPRQRIAFAIEIVDGNSSASRLQTSTADIAGGGCYVETRHPLPLRKMLNITFWLNSKRVQTEAIVRTSDSGVGMGIEFIGLDEAMQKLLQEQIETLAAESGLFRHAHGAF
jgi:PilZ domain